MKNTYHIITIGCQMNKSDSERVAGFLESRGFAPEKNISKAGLVVLATCGVRQSAEDRIYGLVPRIRKNNQEAKIVVTGCLSEREDFIKRVKRNVDLFMPIRELAKLDNYLNNLDGEEAIAVQAKKEPEREEYLFIEPKYESKFSAFVPIGNGCNNFCTYCVVPHARHREVYRPMKEIIREIERLAGNNYKEIILIAQNVNSYRDKNNNFVDLVKKANAIPGHFWLRFATSHPKDMSEELIAALPQLDKMCEYIHLPAQAGNNEILQAMNRNYTVEHYLGLIKKIRDNYSANRCYRNGKLPVCITTDIIVGFPGETEEQFQDTLELFKKAKYDMAYIARYSTRPGTAAEKLKDDIAPEEKQRREEELMKVLRQTALENNQYYKGKEVEVLVEGKNRKGEWFGKTRTFKTVRFQTTANSKRKTGIIGEFVAVKINKAEDFGMRGELC